MGGPHPVDDVRDPFTPVASLAFVGLQHRLQLARRQAGTEQGLAERTAKHQAIRDDLMRVFATVPGMKVRASEAGSYLFPQLPALGLGLHDFVRALRLQAAVTVTPGTEFSPDATDSIRLNFSQNHQAAVSAVERSARMIERYRA